MAEVVLTKPGREITSKRLTKNGNTNLWILTRTNKHRSLEWAHLLQGLKPAATQMLAPIARMRRRSS